MFVTCYMGSKNSSTVTRDRAREIARSIGSDHKEVEIDSIYDSFVNTFSKSTGFTPKFQAHGGTMQEDLSL